ncbi:MAG: hypothetical protein CMP48_14755 [Rickettsiales bacterium]|nr:hypothetical protein [Rickettsiales bacterium]
MTHNPPNWAERFLQWYCNPDLLEEIEGDIYELFDRRLEDRGEKFAKRRFAWDVIRFCRWSNIKRTKSINQRSNSIPMLSNYLKSCFRNMSRYWVTSSVNVFGLAIALGTLLTLFMFIDTTRNMDNYHVKADRTYQLLNYVNSEGQSELWGDSPLELGPALLDNHSQVEDMFRIEFASASVKFDDKVFNESIIFSDPGFLNLLDYPILLGNRNTLSNKDHIIISYNMAEKYFDLEDPVGKLVNLKFSNGQVKSFTVGAVLDQYSYNTSMRFNFILPIAHLEEIATDKTLDWGYFTDATFVLLKESANPGELIAQLDSYVATQNNFDPEWEIESFDLMPLTTLSRHNHEIRGSVAGGSHPAGQIALGVVAILLTVLACLNYMNISIASSTKRLKEIALRKVIGSSRQSIAIQFLVENSLQVLFALIVGALIGYFLFMPGLNTILPFTIPFQFTTVQTTIIFFVALLIGVGVLSSLYPSLYVSKFQPVSIFKGNTRFGTKNIFSKILLTFQLAFAFITVVGCFIFTDNAIYQKQQSWGYDGEDVISVSLSDPAQYHVLEEYANTSPLVADFVGSASQMTMNYDIQVVSQLESEIKTAVFAADAQFPQLMHMQLAVGDWINAELDPESNDQVLINEQFVKKMNWENPIGQKLTLNDQKYSVVGVIGDFQYSTWFAYDQMLPAMIRVAPEKDYSFAIFKSSAGNMDQLDAELKEEWLKIAPNDPYDRVIQANAYDQLYTEMDGNIMVISVISFIAIILAALGLFGLLSFNIQSRLKEFSVRKILGASSKQIIKVASKQYFWIVGIGFAIGAPLGYLSINNMIQSVFPNPKPTGALPFILSIVLMLLALALSIVGQLMKASNVNPVRNLRNE